MPFSATDGWWMGNHNDPFWTRIDGKDEWWHHPGAKFAKSSYRCYTCWLYGPRCYKHAADWAKPRHRRPLRPSKDS